MRVQCLKNQIEKLTADEGLLTYFGSQMHTDDGKLPLTVGQTYMVYALEVRHNGLWYYVCPDGHSDFPVPFTARLFSTVDRRFSRHWVYSQSSDDSDQARVRLVFKEWSRDAQFYSKLLSGTKKNRALFASYRDLIDLEFPDVTVRQPGLALGGQDIHCSACGESFDTDSTDGLVRCTGCGATMRNPFYLQGIIPLRTR